METMITLIRLNVTFKRTLPVWWRSGTFRLLKTCGFLRLCWFRFTSSGTLRRDYQFTRRNAPKVLNLHTAITECGKSNIWTRRINMRVYVCSTEKEINMKLRRNKI